MDSPPDVKQSIRTNVISSKTIDYGMMAPSDQSFFGMRECGMHVLIVTQLVTFLLRRLLSAAKLFDW